MSGDLSELASTSGLLTVLARLQRSGFTGVVYAEHGAESLVVSLRSGHPVFVEDLGEASSIPDMLLEQGFVTKEQYAEIASRVIEAPTENEDIAFCEQAIALGILKASQVEAEIERRIRGRLIQAVSWDECRVDIDRDPDALAGIMELPQDLGSIIFIGVRTFFDDDRVRDVLGTHPARYVRLLRPPAEIEVFFELESEDAALLARLQPDRDVAEIIEQAGCDSLEAHQLLCMLKLAELAEISDSPFSSTAERSGVRTAQAAPPAAPPPPAMPAARNPSVARMPAPRDEAARKMSQARIPIPREDPPPTGSQGRMPAAGSGVREERVVMPGSRSRMPAVPEDRTRAPQGHAPTPAANDPPARAPAEPRARPVSPSPPQSEARRAPTPAPYATPPQRPQSVSLGAPARHPEPQPPPQTPNPLTEGKRPRRKLGQALQRLDRELKQFRAPSAPDVGEGDAAGAPQPSHGRAHLEHLMRMRQATAQKGPAAAAAAPSEGPLQKAQEALRDQQFGRAHELLRKVCEAQPDNEHYAMLHLWAALRSNNLREDGATKLRGLLRARVSDDQHKNFAYYALGHLSLFDKKDEAAEKFFRKAIELDKNNKDAERHLRVIELRRKTAASERNNKIFGIDIGGKKNS